MADTARKREVAGNLNGKTNYVYVNNEIFLFFITLSFCQIYFALSRSTIIRNVIFASSPIDPERIHIYTNAYRNFKIDHIRALPYLCNIFATAHAETATIVRTLLFKAEARLKWHTRRSVIFKYRKNLNHLWFISRISMYTANKKFCH